MESASWVLANEFAKKVIVPLAGQLKPEHIKTLLAEVCQHPELSGANSTPAVLTAVRNSEVVGIDVFSAWAVAGDVHQHFEEIVPVEYVPVPEAPGPPRSD
jgi:hypothetical protein